LAQETKAKLNLLLPAEEQNQNARCSMCLHASVCFKFKNVLQVAEMSADVDKKTGEKRMTIDPTTIAVGCSDYFPPDADLFKNRYGGA